VVADGTDARSKVLEDMATRIVLDFGGSQVSTSWQSFRSYRTAMNALAEAADPAKREGSLQAARLAFQRALDHDPANLLARFNFSNVLRKLGDNEAAVEHYAFLERLVESRDPKSHSVAANRLLDKHPDFLYIVRYNRASALTKIDDWDCHKRAIKLLEGLIVDVAAAQLTDEDRVRLQLLVRATWSSAWVFRLEQLRRDARVADQRKAIVGQIEAIRDYVEELPAEEPVPEWTTYVTARATVQNALGRAYYLVGKNDEAYEAFERALSMMADFGDARVNLASLLIRQKGRYPRWSRRAEEQLKRALELSPHDRKAKFLLGVLYKDPAVNRIGDAKKEFIEVDDALSLFNLAEVYEREGDLAAAVSSLRRSIYLSPRTDFRTRLYLEWLLRLHKKTSQSREALEDGVQLGEKLVKASSEAKRQDAAKLRDGVKKALAKLG
jgi:tetratricopeptide (TPR) repeat protein